MIFEVKCYICQSYPSGARQRRSLHVSPPCMSIFVISLRLGASSFPFDWARGCESLVLKIPRATRVISASHMDSTTRSAAAEGFSPLLMLFILWTISRYCRWINSRYYPPDFSPPTLGATRARQFRRLAAARPENRKNVTGLVVTLWCATARGPFTAARPVGGPSTSAPCTLFFSHLAAVALSWCNLILAPHARAFTLRADSSIMVSFLADTSGLPATHTSVTWLRCVQ